jgi:hypothetical protein
MGDTLQGLFAQAQVLGRVLMNQGMAYVQAIVPAF